MLNVTVAVWINNAERLVMKIKVQYNKDKQVVEMIKNGLKEKMDIVRVALIKHLKISVCARSSGNK